MKLISFILIFFGFLIYSFFNLGKFLDVTQEPSKTDLIVSLGGGDGERIKKAVFLYNNKFSSSNFIILTGNIKNKLEKNDKRLDYLNSFPSINFIHEKNLFNTLDEMNFIINYSLSNKINNIMIISDAPHTRRIEMLLKMLQKKYNTTLNFNIVASDSHWWNKKTYYKTKKGISFAYYELIKIIYSYFIYNLTLNVKLFENLESHIQSQINFLRKNINSSIYYYLKE